MIGLWINRVLLTLLAFNTAIVKLLQMEFEMALFAGVGVPDAATIALGAVQLAGAVLLIPKRTTRVGAWVLFSTFVFATGVLFVAGMVPFGLFSLVFIAMAALHATRWPREA